MFGPAHCAISQNKRRVIVVFYFFQSGHAIETHIEHDIEFYPSAVCQIDHFFLFSNSALCSVSLLAGDLVS